LNFILKTKTFFRNYIDKLCYQGKPDRRKRIRFIDDSKLVQDEKTAPINAPRWTKSGYNGSLRKLINDAVSNYQQ
jgi:hypothetical protein